MVTIAVCGDTPQETMETVRLLSSPAVINNLHLQTVDNAPGVQGDTVTLHGPDDGTVDVDGTALD